MQPKDAGAGVEEGMTLQEMVKAIIDDIVQKLPEEFNLYELNQKAE